MATRVSSSGGCSGLSGPRRRSSRAREEPVSGWCSPREDPRKRALRRVSARSCGGKAASGSSRSAVDVGDGGAIAEGDASREWVRTAEDWTHLFAEHSPQSLSGIAYIARNAANGDTDSAIVRAGHLLGLFKQLPANDSGLRVYLLTQRAQAVEADDVVDGFWQASAAGFFRVAHNEYPGLTCSVIDHDGHRRAPLTLSRNCLPTTRRTRLRGGRACGIHSASRPARCWNSKRTTSPDARCHRRPADATSWRAPKAVSRRAGDPQRDVLYWKSDAARQLADDELEIEVAYWQVQDTRRPTRAHAA